MTFARWGLHGNSVFGLPEGDYERLGRLVPLFLDRQWILEAAGSDVLADGFPVVVQPAAVTTGPEGKC